MKIWQKKVGISGLLFLAVAFFTSMMALSDSKNCSICGYIKCHAPCILNLNTGEIDELQLYTPHDQEVGKLAEEQIGGTFGFLSVAGVHGTRQTDTWYIELKIPVAGKSKKTAHFCDNCRLLLEDYEDGFVLVDVFDLENPAIYEIEADASYEMRCYKIGISFNQEDECYLLRLDGTL